ncbi:MAG TPA: DUF2652 domain-containing protein [Actinomycetota bacterium]|nr:DUF2652 domain-containing protein [Actinomycetota bacterium]
MAIEQGCLLLADISGYTKYLTGVELDHSQDILSDLLDTIVRQLTGVLALAKIEGDAVFCFGSDDAEALSGPTLITMVEGCYFAFEERVRNIKNLTTCDCNACVLIPTLTLKFLIHRGEYVLHEVAGNKELLGADVILAHRLLKNHVTEETGLRGYALFTQAAVTGYRIDTGPAGLAEHTEDYDDVGQVPAFLLDLEARWRAEQERRVVYVSSEDALIESTVDVPAPPALTWEYLTSPESRVRWQPGAVAVEQDNPNGVPGVGTTNHCVHGEYEVNEEILDWKPFRYETVRSKGPVMTVLMTFELTPLDDEITRVTSRVQPEGDPPPEGFGSTAEMFRQVLELSMGEFVRYARERVSQPA